MVAQKIWPMLAGLLFVMLLASPAASAASMDKALHGNWTRAGGSCDQDSTFKIDGTSLSGSEYLCSPQRIKREKGGWRIGFACSGEGNEYALQLHWRLLKNGDLREVANGKTKLYARCSLLNERLLDPANPYTAPSRCVACFNEAQSLRKSVGGYCPSACADVFGTMTCDSKGICHLPD